MAILDVNWDKLSAEEQAKVKPMLDDGRMYILRDDVYFYEPLVSWKICAMSILHDDFLSSQANKNFCNTLFPVLSLVYFLE